MSPGRLGRRAWESYRVAGAASGSYAAAGQASPTKRPLVAKPVPVMAYPPPSAFSWLWQAATSDCSPPAAATAAVFTVTARPGSAKTPEPIVDAPPPGVRPAPPRSRGAWAM
ncbi:MULTISPECIES: hypothetical protein [unclassified Streptomyces]|uniref:hypothetical protein n=1 Tax=unclassified Streptomyces TaxID=2593676 RepID=UPI00332D3E70